MHRKLEVGKKITQTSPANVTIPNFKDLRHEIPVTLNTKSYSSLKHLIVKSMFFSFSLSLNFPFLISSHYSLLILYETSRGRE